MIRKRALLVDASSSQALKVSAIILIVYSARRAARLIQVNAASGSASGLVGSTRSAHYLTTTTGTSANCTTLATTEPRSKPDSRPRPRLPMTISLHFDFLANAMIHSAGSPVST